MSKQCVMLLVPHSRNDAHQCGHEELLQRALATSSCKEQLQ
jgi:hypothetical protein